MRRWAILFFLLFFIASGVIYEQHNPEKNKVKNDLVLYGNVDVRQVDLGFRVSGRVREMVYQEGDFVQAGEWMARLDHQPYQDLVQQAQAALEATQAQVTNSQKALNRREELRGEKSVSEEDYETALYASQVYRANLKQAEAALGVAHTNLQDTQLYAPNEGIILTRIREPGSVVRESDPIYTLSLLSPIWVRAFVTEPELGLVYPGMRAQVLTDTEGGPIYEGQVGFISPVAEFTPKTVETSQLRTDLVYRLRIIVDHPDQGLRQGMPVTVKLSLTPLKQ